MHVHVKKPTSQAFSKIIPLACDQAMQITSREPANNKSRGRNGLHPAFFQKTSREISKILNKLFKNIKRLRKIPDGWKTAAATPIHKKGDRCNVGNYRSVSLLDIESKIFEKCIYIDLYIYYLPSYQTSTRICEAQIRSFEHVFVSRKNT